MLKVQKIEKKTNNKKVKINVKAEQTIIMLNDDFAPVIRTKKGKIGVKKNKMKNYWFLFEFKQRFNDGTIKNY